MKRYLLLLIVFSTWAHAFEPICNTPQSLKKKDLNGVILSKDALEQNQLIIYSVNPPTPIDWSTPKNLFDTIVKNSLLSESYEDDDFDHNFNPIKKRVLIKSHSVGHMFVQLSCAGYPSILTGMSSPSTEVVSGLMIKGKSFSHFTTAAKGYFNTSQELQEEIDIRRKKVGNLHYMGINLRPGSCEELLKYLSEFKACGLDQRYGGLDANPHKGEGSICSSFAISFLQRLNIIPMIDKIKPGEFGSEFLRTVEIPLSMLETEKQNPEIGAWNLLKGTAVSWAESGAGRKTVFFDPELFSKWVDGFSQNHKAKGLIYRGREGGELVKGVWFDEKSKDILPNSFSLDFLFN
nr:hypothetical protein BHI3_29970 [Bacteriovorax sp. HI3]